MPRYKIKKGMLTHPFSDLSGCCFYSTETTVLTSISLEESAMLTLLDKPDLNDERDSAVINELLSKGFIEEICTE